MKRKVILHNSELEGDEEILDEELVITLEDKLAFWEDVNFYGQSALGDDYTGYTIIKKSTQTEKFGELYANIAGWEVAWHKSLTTPMSTEFLREQTIPGYVMKVRLTSDDNIDQIKVFVLIVKPLSHVLRTMFFPESLDNAGKAISLLSQLMRLGNIRYHPNLYNIIMDIKDYFPMKLLTEDSWYVPLYNLDAWVKSGKPSDGSPYHVKITNITSLVTIATREAEFLQLNLNQVLDIAWTKASVKDYDPVSELPKMREVRMLEAIRTKNMKEVELIESEVRKISDLSFIINYNNPVLEEESLEELIVEESKMRFIKN